jgi:hypothetical protein
MSLNKIKRRLDNLATRLETAARSGEPPADYPPADLIGRALADWVRNTPPGPPDWLPEASIIRSKLAATYTHVMLAVGEVMGNRKLARQAAELVLREHQAALQAGKDYPRPCLNIVDPDGEEVWEEHDPEAVERLLLALGFNPPPDQADVQAPR